MPIHAPFWGVLGACEALMQGLQCLSFMLLLLAYYCTHYAVSDRRYLKSLGYPIFWVTLGVYCMLTQKLVPGRRPDVYIPGQATHAYILRYWYLVPLIKHPWAAGL